MSAAHAAVVAALVAAAVYANAPANGFALDDVVIVQQDTAIHRLSVLPSLITRGYWADDPALALYRPLTSATFALDWAASGGSAGWFHAVNVAWHALASALAALLVATLFGAGAALPAGIVFAVHPAHVEAVANIVGRAELMAGAACFAAALAWLRLRGRRRTALTSVLFAAGLLAKESVIALPLLLLLVDAAAGTLQRGRVRAYARANAVAYAALALVAGGYLLLRLAVLGGIAPARLDPALEVAPGALARMLTAQQAWPHYLRLLLFPRVLLADYGPPITMPVPPVTAAAVLGMVVIAAAAGFGALAFWRGHGRAALLLLWVPVALLPVSSAVLPIGVIVAERLLYVPSLAVAAAVGVLVAGARQRGAVPRVAIPAAFAVSIVLAAARTWTRTPDWQSTDHVFAAQLATRPDNFRAHWHRARALRSIGDERAALDAYRVATGLWPFRPGLLREAALFEAEHGDPLHARGLARFGIERWPADPELHGLAARISLELGDTADALAAARAGLELHPGDASLRRTLAGAQRSR